MAAIIVTLECISNLHVGNGEANYNIVDNEVARDAVTGYPTINASGVKGALREYFATDSALKNHVDAIFGAGDNNDTPGLLKFFSADMAALAVRASKGPAAYYLLTTETALSKLSDNHKIFLGKPLSYTTTNCTGCGAEDISLPTSTTLLGKTLYILPEKDFRTLSLPVVARNQLDNGKSENLWYEEFVPHESIFTFVVYCNEQNANLLATFKAGVDGKVVQFGANASVGGGYCKVSVEG